MRKKIVIHLKSFSTRQHSNACKFRLIYCSMHSSQHFTNCLLQHLSKHLCKPIKTVIGMDIMDDEGEIAKTISSQIYAHLHAHLNLIQPATKNSFWHSTSSSSIYLSPHFPYYFVNIFVITCYCQKQKQNIHCLVSNYAEQILV